VDVSESSGTEATPPSKRVERKRKSNPEEWKCNIKKRKLNSGKSYEVIEKGKTVKKPSKAMKPPCGENCRKKCTDNFSEEERLEIFQDFGKWAP